MRYVDGSAECPETTVRERNGSKARSTAGQVEKRSPETRQSGWEARAKTAQIDCWKGQTLLITRSGRVEYERSEAKAI